MMPERAWSASSRHSGRKAGIILLAASLLFSQTASVFADGVNGTFDGRDVAGGTYRNTPDSQTTFVNSGGTGLYIKAGDTVVGREVDPGTLLENGNGGNLRFHAPGQVVRIDGNIDVSGFLKGGALGNGGRVTVDSAYLYQNGQIFANGANAGMIQMNVGTMTMGPGARIEAMGLQGTGGVVNIDARNGFTMARGAVIDSSGAVIGTYNTNVIQIKGDMVNLDGIIQANGLAPGQPGGIVSISASNSVSIGPNGQLLAKGADGFSGDHPTDGANGGLVSVTAGKHIDHNGLIAANGGQGGTNPAIAAGPVVDNNGVKQQFSQGQDGANGGNGGGVVISYKGSMTGNGDIEVIGGNGGDGQKAISDTPINGPHEHIAIGGNGGNGGSGGLVEFHALPPQAVLDRVKIGGGSGGSGGAAATLNDCGCKQPGVNGGCGGPGQIVILPPGKTPPPTTTTSLFPLYPKEYPRVGDTLQATSPPVLNYNRSVFLARSPFPVVHRKPPVVVTPPPVSPPPPPKNPLPVKPKAIPQRKVRVRGFW